MHTVLKSAAVLLLLGGCGYVNAYEEAVYEHEPVYCYQTLAAVQCFDEPQHTDKQRLVNYYGPHPTRYDEPDVPDTPELQAPEAIETWVKDPEPVPQPAVKISTSTISPGAPTQPSVKKSKVDAEELARLHRELKGMLIREPLPPSSHDPIAKEVVLKED